MTQSISNGIKVEKKIEKRGKPRMKCAYAALVRGNLPNGRYFEENATVLNLSARGVFMTVNRLMEVGQVLSLKIAFPTGSLKWGSSILNSSGVVVRTETLNEGLMGVAVKFEHYQFS